MDRFKSFLHTGALAIATAGASVGQTTVRVSIATGGAQANDFSSDTSISADGRYVAFASYATNLVTGDTNGDQDVFVYDSQNRTVERVSVATGGVQGNIESDHPSISADGRYVAFEGPSTNLVSGDTNTADDVFVRDRQLGTTARVSVATNGLQATGHSQNPSISADGRYVVFHSTAANLVPGDTNGTEDVFLHDRQTGTTVRSSVATGGAQGNGRSILASISADGRYVAFLSLASNLVPGDANGLMDAFLHDRQTGTTERVGVEIAPASPRMSADGRFVAFASDAPNLVAGDTNGVLDVFVLDRQSGETGRVSVATNGAEGNGMSGDRGFDLSADGRFVAFDSFATNFAAGDVTPGDVFVRDRQSGTTQRVSIATGGAPGNVGDTGFPTLSGDGRYAAFYSRATNLVAGDTNGIADVFVHDRDTAGFPMLCEPGVQGVLACPCSNSPSGPGRGCNNSSGTGGASVAASGIAQLSADSLVFTTSGERPTSLSILEQGNVFLPGGVIYGQGVRCFGGALKRLFTKSAAGGSITAPGPEDPSVSAQSAAKGDTIQAGQSRWYHVWYRDPNVLGGCPAISTFTATHARQVTWAQ